MPTFRDFITDLQVTGDAQGDFIEATQRLYELPWMPGDFFTLDHFLGFVTLRWTSWDAVKAARAVWDQFEAWRHKRVKMILQFNAEILGEVPWLRA